MAERHLQVKYALSKVHLFPKAWLPQFSSHFLSVIHDPCEIFPQKRDWRSSPPFLGRLTHFSRLAVISNEMNNILAAHGADCSKVNTRSTLPFRTPETLEREPLAVFARSTIVPRKNLRLFFQVRSDVSDLVGRFHGYFNRDILAVADYIRLIDSYNCYVCTSWQEGGPLPVLDAMHRGCAILTTPVGQTDEWIKEGVNGFFCQTRRDFVRRIQYLASNPDVLYNLRRNSIARALSNDEALIRDQLRLFLGRT
jgi:glycosyltransferase involved in cell wall biosynthesis